MSTKNITYAGHSAVFVTLGSKIVAIDPWLQGNPSCPDTIAKSPKCDLIVLTHGHSDHASDVVRISKLTGAPVAATFELASILAGEGIPWEKLIPLNKGGTSTVLGITVTLTHAFHSNSYDVASGAAVYAGEACGVVVKNSNWCVYHAGDTALFSDMKLIGEIYKPDVALLPIGDRFTMGPREAALAATYIGAPTVIPIHYATFDMLTGTAADFEAACGERNIKPVVLKAGESREF